MNSNLFIISGANGSGKSTFANEILKIYPHIEFVNADNIAKGLSEDLNSVKVQAGKIAINRMNELIDLDKSFIIETTLSGSYTKKIIEKAKLKKYNIMLTYVFVDNVNICIDRVKSRFVKGGHNVPVEDIIRRYYKSVNNFMEYIKIVDKWELFYNGIESSTLVAKGQKDIVSINNDRLYSDFLNRTKNERR